MTSKFQEELLGIKNFMKIISKNMMNLTAQNRYQKKTMWTQTLSISFQTF